MRNERGVVPIFIVVVFGIFIAAWLIAKKETENEEAINGVCHLDGVRNAVG